MRKIYMVVANNGQSYEDHEHWNVAAFTSEEAAKVYIEQFTNEIHAAVRRVEELEELFDERKPTPEEDEEYGRVNDLACEYWHFFDKGKFYIEEFELRE